MTRIEPIEWTEKTALRERDQLRDAVNVLIENINGTAGDADAAAASALKAEQEANRSAEFARAAQMAADTAIGKADGAIATANGASAVANGIDGKATQALQQSAAAVATANGIDAKAQNALDTAGDAMTEASDATAKAIANGKAINASNGRIGKLEQSQGQQDAKLERTVNISGDQKINGVKTFDREIRLYNPTYKGQEDAIFPLGRLITIFGGVVGPFMYNGQNVSKLPEKATVIGANGFSGVTVSDTTARIAGISFDTRAFGGCNVTKLICTTAYTLVFYGCMRDSQITHMEVNNFSYLGSNCLSQCNLDTLVIRNTGDDTVPVLPANALNDTPISQGTGLIYVRDDLVDIYKQATNWVTYANQIKPVSQLPPEASA